ncbi:MAG: ribonuclease J [Chloroflexi bacterium]|nr:ribonuclease J [Chloroflexota bacterium]
MHKDKVRIIPLGGVGQIGKNMTVIEYEDQLLVIDAGVMFPENEMLGVDIVIPDMTYVIERKDKVRAIILTHGHEDHIGALPYLVEHVKAPMYATRLTQGLAEVKLREHHVRDAEFHVVSPDDVLALKPFRIEFFHVSHSIPDGVGLAIRTPVGLIVHSGDFKFDHSPVDGRLTDFAKLADLGRRGTLVLLSDSTNAETPGYTPSEREIARTFDDIFNRAKGRVIVATFASNISRIQQVLDTARRYNRRVAVVGRSMVNNVRIAEELGYLKAPNGVLVNVEEVNRLPPRQAAVVCTGSQGEPTSALVRMSMNTFPAVNLVPGDTVVVSATPIPGNEELINRTLNNLFRLGANVYYDELLDVHVSGHASQEELKMMISLVRPRYFVPIHGEYRHLVLHAQLAEQVGISPDHIFILECGDVLEVSPDEAKITGRVSEEQVLVDGLGVGDVGRTVLEDRRILSRNGFIVAVVAIAKDSGRIVSGPEIISRGFVYIPEAEDLLAGAKALVEQAVAKGGGADAIGQRVREWLSKYAYEEIKRRPIVIPVVMEV